MKAGGIEDTEDRVFRHKRTDTTQLIETVETVAVCKGTSQVGSL